MWGVVLAGMLVGGPAAAQDRTPAFPESPRTVDPATVEWSACWPDDPEGCEFAHLDGDPSTGPSISLLRLRPGPDAPLLQHPETSTSIVVVEGTLAVVDADGTEVALAPGMYGHVPAGRVHGERCLPGPTCVWYEFRDGPLHVVWVDGPAVPRK